MPTIEFEGKNTEDAIQKALNQLHLAADELRFVIVSTGSSGIFGLGGKKAVIRVTVEERISAKKAEQPTTPTPAEIDRPEPRPRPEPNEIPRRKAEREPRREVRRDSQHSESRRLDRRPPGERPARQAQRPTARITPRPGTAPSHGPMPSTVPGPGEELYSGPEDEIMSQSRQALEGLLTHMGLSATVKVNRIQDRIILAVEGENTGLLIGKKGATLDAIQFVINKIINKVQNDKYRVIVDAEDYRQRRHQSLIQLAQRMAEKAQRIKRPVTISQLSAHDRRVVHLALQETAGLKTRSRGEGPFKNVIIIPEDLATAINGDESLTGEEFEEEENGQALQ